MAFTTVAPPKVMIGLVICFAFFHGHAHATEMLAETSLSLYLAGLLASTALLHTIGVAAGVVIEKLNSWHLARCAGGGIALVGLMLMVGLT